MCPLRAIVTLTWLHLLKQVLPSLSYGCQKLKCLQESGRKYKWSKWVWWGLGKLQIIYTPSDKISSYLATADCCLINPYFKENHLYFKEKPKFFVKCWYVIKNCFNHYMGQIFLKRKKKLQSCHLHMSCQ